MSEQFKKMLAPVEWPPAGLITWYAPDGRAVALVASWVALIGGTDPRVRTSWHGHNDTYSRLWTGGDFVYNVPSEDGLDRLGKIVSRGRLCLSVEDDLGYICQTGVTSVAPRLVDCMVQIECVKGHLVEATADVELCGDAVRLHRDDRVIDLSRVVDLCAINPLGRF